MSVDALQGLLEEGVAAGVFPAAQAVVLHQGSVRFDGHAGAAEATTLFDLASLTKVMSTTAAFMALWAEGALGPRTPVARFFSGTPCAANAITLEDLLFHRAGLPAYTPYFAAVLRAVPELLNEDVPRAVREEVRKEVVAAVAQTPPLRPKGEAALYSDVGFILLGEVLQQASNERLDELYLRRVAGPLGLDARFHRLTARASWTGAACAPTGDTRPREAVAGQEDFARGLARRPSRPGSVDDDNAWVLDGVAGHAGLFGTARGVARFGQAVLEELGGAAKLAPAALWERAMLPDAETPGSTRALGFDTPSVQGSSAGQFIGKRAPGAFGHLGFTGTSLWVDRARALVVALCTNCTGPGRKNQPRIREFRPRFHDAVVEALGLT